MSPCQMLVITMLTKVALALHFIKINNDYSKLIITIVRQYYFGYTYTYMLY